MIGGTLSKGEHERRPISLMVVLALIFGAFVGLVNLASENVRAQDAYEPDNTLVDASLIPTDGTMQSHTFHVTGDVDWIAFSTTVGNHYTIETHNLVNSDTMIYLYHTNGVTQVAWNDDGGVGLASRIDWTSHRTDIFYLEVVENAGGGGPGYSYDINVVEGVPSHSFALEIIPFGYQRISPGDVATYYVNIKSVGSYAGNVGLSLTATPAGLFPPATHNLVPNPVTVPAGGSVTSTLTIDNTAPVVEGIYSLTIIGNDGTTVWGSKDVFLYAYSVPFFAVTADPYSQTIAPGDTATYTLTVESKNDYTGTVTLDLSAMSPGLIPPATFGFSQNPVVVPAGGSMTSTLTIDNTATAWENTYVLCINACDPGCTAFYAELIIQSGGTPSFTVSVTPSTQAKAPGDAATYSVTVTSVNNYAGNVDFSVTAAPVGLIPPAAGTFNPTTVTVPAGGGATSTLTIDDTGTVAGDTYTLTVTGTDGILTKTGTADLVIAAPHLGTIKGIVTDQDNNPVDGATVTLLDGNDNVVKTTNTNSTGGYEFTNVGADDYRVRASREGYAPDEKSVTLAVGGTKTVDLQIKLGKISGKITDEKTDKPIEGAKVRIFDENGDWVDTITTDENGRFSIHLPLGTYRIEIEADGYKKTTNEDVELTESDSEENLGTLEVTPEEGRAPSDYWWIIVLIIITVIAIIVAALLLRSKKPKPAPTQPPPEYAQAQVPPPQAPQETPPPPPPQ
jgi:uncharacterized membrane protein